MNTTTMDLLAEFASEYGDRAIEYTEWLKARGIVAEIQYENYPDAKVDAGRWCVYTKDDQERLTVWFR